MYNAEIIQGYVNEASYIKRIKLIFRLFFQDKILKKIEKKIFEYKFCHFDCKLRDILFRMGPWNVEDQKQVKTKCKQNLAIKYFFP